MWDWEKRACSWWWRKQVQQLCGPEEYTIQTLDTNTRLLRKTKKISSLRFEGQHQPEVSPYASACDDTRLHSILQKSCNFPSLIGVWCVLPSTTSYLISSTYYSAVWICWCVSVTELQYHSVIDNIRMLSMVVPQWKSLSTRTFLVD